MCCVCGYGGAAPIPCVQDIGSAPSTHIRSTLLFVLDKQYLQWRSSSLTDVGFNLSLPASFKSRHEKIMVHGAWALVRIYRSGGS